MCVLMQVSKEIAVAFIQISEIKRYHEAPEVDLHYGYMRYHLCDIRSTRSDIHLAFEKKA